MLDKTAKHEPEVTEKDLGLGVRFAASVGEGRQIEMTAGVPLSYTADQINELLDRLSKAFDRQAEKGRLASLKALLESASRQYATNLEQLANYQAKNVEDWQRSNRAGPFKATQSQLQQEENYKKNSQHLEKQIEKVRQDIAEAEAKCR